MENTEVKILRSGLSVSVGEKEIHVSLFSDANRATTNSPDICLIIYGGSRDFSQDKLYDMKALLCENNFIAASFDFRGMGPDSSDFENTGLHTRIKDAREVLRQIIFTFPASRIFVIGVSMGGYIATFLDPREIAGMVLVAPAAYDVRAVHEKVNFGPKFSEIIRREKSYLDSDAFVRMRKFRLVRTAIISFDDDEVVPEDVILRYFNAHLGSIEYRKTLKVLPGKHNGNFSNPERIREIVNTVVRL